MHFWILRVPCTCLSCKLQPWSCFSICLCIDFLKCGHFNKINKVWERLPMVAQKEGRCLSSAPSGNQPCSLIMAEEVLTCMGLLRGGKGAVEGFCDTVRARHLKLVIWGQKGEKINNSTAPGRKVWGVIKDLRQVKQHQSSAKQNPIFPLQECNAQSCWWDVGTWVSREGLLCL